MSQTTSILAAVLAALLASCAQTGAPDTGEDPYELDGKADGSGPAVVVEAVDGDESLWSRGLQRMICNEIVDGHAWPTVADRTAFSDGCYSHVFQVTEKTTSTLYGHLRGDRAITFGMKVRVTADAGTWNAELSREWHADYRFRWTAEVPDTANARDDYIRRLADDMGEYFRPDDESSVFRATRFDALPDFIQTSARERVAAITERWREEEGRTDYAELADDYPYEILDEDGELVGYVVQIWYMIDAPLFDGGGLTLYYNILGDEVHDEVWWG